MEQSRTLMTAQIHFIEDRLSLIHIPRKLYASYIQPILQLLYPIDNQPNAQGTNGHDRSHHDTGLKSWSKSHPFLNVSVTPIECSIICSRTLAERHFIPAIERMPSKERATVSSEEFVAVSVEGEGLEAGQRVLELTTPLAMAGISIFFFTTYFSDYVLVPSKARAAVIRALEERGFAFSASSHAYVNIAASHARNASSSSLSNSFALPESPTTPPPSSISELQSRTITLLRQRRILPRVHPKLRLLHLAARNDETDLGELQVGITKCLIHPPDFFSLTLTDLESPSLLICSNSLSHFGPNYSGMLLGSKEEYLIPITLDLEPLPLEATGIVCGVSSKLVGDTTTNRIMGTVEMRYLSTARGAAVIVDEADLERAVDLLSEGEGGLDITGLD